jgi:hypothetical protein
MFDFVQITSECSPRLKLGEAPGPNLTFTRLPRLGRRVRIRHFRARAR